MTTPAYSTPMLSGVKPPELCCRLLSLRDRKSTRLNSSHSQISYAVFCLKKKKKNEYNTSDITKPQYYKITKRVKLATSDEVCDLDHIKINIRLTSVVHSYQTSVCSECE